MGCFRAASWDSLQTPPRNWRLAGIVGGYQARLTCTSRMFSLVLNGSSIVLRELVRM